MKFLVILLCVSLAAYQVTSTPVAPREITDDEISLPDHITPEMFQCIDEVLRESHDNYPHIAWWFADAAVVLWDLGTSYNACNDFLTNAAQTACRATVTAQAAIQLNRLRNTVNDNMEDGHIWFDNLRSNWQECLAE